MRQYAACIKDLTFLQAVLASLGWLGRTIRSTVALLLAQTAGSGEFMSNCRVGALGLHVAVPRLALDEKMLWR
jgi:hypothetical protein